MGLLLGEIVRRHARHRPEQTAYVIGPHRITYRQLNSLVRYVRYLRDPIDRGGASLNRVGPLIEGLVAILVGLGLIVVLTRFLGTRSS